jgi:Domain of unknown function (DUF4288)
MKWYAAHVILALIEFETNKLLEKSIVWENIYVINADSYNSAMIKAKELGSMEEYADREGHLCEGVKVKWSFIGVRKLSECLLGSDEISNGDEITFNEYEMNQQDIKKFLSCDFDVDLKLLSRINLNEDSQ